jgi:hypothetical protein
LRGGRRTIVSALSSAWPEPRKQLPPRASKLDPRAWHLSHPPDDAGTDLAGDDDALAAAR